MEHTTYIVERQGEIFYACAACARYAIERDATAVAYPVGGHFSCEPRYEAICLDTPAWVPA